MNDLVVGMAGEQIRQFWDGCLCACQERREPTGHQLGINHDSKRGDTDDRQQTDKSGEAPRTSADGREGELDVVQQSFS